MKVELDGIDKRFGRIHANKAVSLSIPPGRILGVLGENGAGKSTLMKILSGFYRPDAGRILVDGTPVELRSPADALQAGIGMLHQDPMDFPRMTTMENFLAGQPGFRWNARAVLREMERWAERMGFEFSPGALVETLTVGERQQLELMRLLATGSQLLILDEPTTGISAVQKQKLFSALRTLADEGRSVVLVSHKLRDVEALCHEVVVLRAGRLVGHREAPCDLDDLVRLMFERPVRVEKRRVRVSNESAVMHMSGLTAEWRGGRIGPVDLDLRAGEVIGIAGMEGSGQDIFLRACCGWVRPVAGRLVKNGRDLAGRSFLEHRRAGVAFVPAARLEEGLVAGLTLAEHVALMNPGGGMAIRWPRILRVAAERIAQYNIRGAPETVVESLSGGNQQRTLLALVPESADVLLLEHPTRGLDIESVAFVWSKLQERCAAGAGVLFVSADLEEILQYSDRILVFFAGRAFGPFPAAETDVEQLGSLIGGRA